MHIRQHVEFPDQVQEDIEASRSQVDDRRERVELVEEHNHFLGGGKTANVFCHGSRQSQGRCQRCDIFHFLPQGVRLDRENHNATPPEVASEAGQQSGLATPGRAEEKGRRMRSVGDRCVDRLEFGPKNPLSPPQVCRPGEEGS